MSRTKHWLLATRPKTLGISITPVLCGSALAWTETGSLHWLPAIAALCSAILIQIGTNLYNDAADFERGADTRERIGPKRATAEGWFAVHQVKRAAHISFGLASLAGIYLVWLAGWPLLVAGLFSLLAGYGYTAGPRPIAYSGVGELFVFVFFGLLAVMGSYYIQCACLSGNAFLVACAVGTLAAAVLLVNNYRDLETDERAGKLTLVHYLGRKGSRLLYGFLLLAPFSVLFFLSDTGGNWLALLALPPALVLLHRFVSLAPGPAFNLVLAQTAKLQLIYGLLLTLGLVLW